jgi:hypothetical protein
VGEFGSLRIFWFTVNDGCSKKITSNGFTNLCLTLSSGVGMSFRVEGSK